MWFVHFFNAKGRLVTERDLMASSHCAMRDARTCIKYLVKHEYLISLPNGYKPAWDISTSFFEKNQVQTWALVEAELTSKERIELARILRARCVSAFEVCRLLKRSISWVTHHAPMGCRRWQRMPLSLKYPHARREDAIPIQSRGESKV
jgi:hypothetical protein